MRLLVLAQTPPPVHGQSLMVEVAVRGLPAAGVEVTHVQMRLSDSSERIGRWSLAKVWRTLAAALAARRALRHCDALYYVPAPGKRGALYRDIAVMGICRDRRKPLILHWHAIGLGAWLERRATAPERWLARRALGAADLSIVLDPALASDAELLFPRRLACVPNGAPDPGAPAPRSGAGRVRLLYLGLGSEEKGLFDLLDAVAILEAREPGRFTLTYAGSFEGTLQAEAFNRRAAAMPGIVAHAGFANDAQKHALLDAADIFCMPTRYPHEGQPLALIEAMAHDLKIVASRWRAIPAMLPEAGAWLVDPSDPSGLAAAIRRSADAPAPAGAVRAHYLARFTLDRHLGTFATSLLGSGLRQG